MGQFRVRNQVGSTPHRQNVTPIGGVVERRHLVEGKGSRLIDVKDDAAVRMISGPAG